MVPIAPLVLVVLVTKEADIAVPITLPNNFSLLLAAIALLVPVVLVTWVQDTAKLANRSLRGNDALQVAPLQVCRDFLCFYPRF